MRNTYTSFIRHTVGGALTALCLLPAWAGRPLTVDDAWTVSPGDCELEAGVAFDQQNGDRHWEFPFGVTVGMIPTLELGIAHGAQTDDHEIFDGSWDTECGFNDLLAGVKWNPLSEERFWAAQALAFTVKLPTACDDYGSGETDYDLTWIASKMFCDSWNAHVNVGYTWVGDSSDEDYDDIFHCGTAAGWFATERLELVAELCSEIPATDCSEATLVFNGGVRWMVRENLILDAAVGSDLRRNNPDFMATIGFTWTFGIWRQRQNSKQS